MKRRAVIYTPLLVYMRTSTSPSHHVPLPKHIRLSEESSKQSPAFKHTDELLFVISFLNPGVLIGAGVCP